MADTKHKAPLTLLLVALLALAAVLCWPMIRGSSEIDVSELEDGTEGAAAAGAAAPSSSPAEAGDTSAPRSLASSGSARIRGRILHLESGQPASGVEVLALDRHPAFAEVELRILDLLEAGFWEQRPAGIPPPPRILARTESGVDGRFELDGLPPGLLFLDARSGRCYTRFNPAWRLSGRERIDGVELLVSPGGRVRGRVLDPEGQPVSGARVVLRPGANAFLAQLTRGASRWIETSSDSEGSFDIPGVPPGDGYALSGIADGMALAQAREIRVTPGEPAVRTLRGRVGGVVEGRVRKEDGSPAQGALVGFAYLDLARILFSLGTKNPVRTDQEGRFRLQHIGAGLVAIGALMPGRSIAEPLTLTMADGARHVVELELGIGYELEGRVIDGSGDPIAGVRVTARGLEQPRGFDLSLLAKYHVVEGKTDREGQFQLDGLLAERVFVHATKEGLLPAQRRFRREAGEQPFLELTMLRGIHVSGRVSNEDDEPVRRFRVVERESRRARRMRTGSDLLSGRNPWQERSGKLFENDEGLFRIGPFAPGKLRLRVEADGFVRSEYRELELERGSTPEPLVFRLSRGATLRGQVVSRGIGVGAAQVTWSRVRRRNGGPSFLPFRIDMQAEDFDSLALSSAISARSVLTAADGGFELRGVPPGKITLTARQASLAKSSAKELVVEGVEPIEGIVLELGSGGSILGRVSGLDGNPLAGAMIMAFSFAKGVMRSTTTNQEGAYRMDGLAPGPYVVFKTRMDATKAGIWNEMLGNVRLKSTTVREGRASRVDIADLSEGGVDVFGRVSSGGEPARGAVLTLLGQDRSGPFGIGLRTGTADEQGNYFIASVPAGRYTCRLTRYTGTRAEAATLPFEVTGGTERQRIDLQFPSGVLSGSVTDPSGSPLSGIRVVAVREGRRPGGLLGMLGEAGGTARTRTDQEGFFRLRRLPRGSWKIRAEPPGAARDGHASAEIRGIFLETGQELRNLIVVLPRAAVLEGRILDSQGTPIAGANVSARRKDPAASEVSGSEEVDVGRLVSQLRHMARSGADGRFRLRGLMPGSWTVQAERKGLMTARAETLIAGHASPPELELRMLRGARLHLRVRDLDGHPFKRGSVRVLDSSGRVVGGERSLFSVLQGLFRTKKDDRSTGWMDMGVLAPDTYTLEVRETRGGKSGLRRVTRILREGEEARWELAYSDLVPEEPDK
ncbi:MAG: carboxypeptidase regulatory-like domain-containing protein [Planctomycetota bacterium]